jgi:hypothetical protein
MVVKSAKMITPNVQNVLINKEMIGGELDITVKAVIFANNVKSTVFNAKTT